jgi:adenosylcobinamide-phosphate synthase
MLAGSLVIDITLGELPTPIHPVGWMGKLASLLEKPGLLGRPWFQLVYGVLLTLLLAALFTVSGYFILTYAKSINTIVYVVIGAALLKSCFSLDELRKAALRVKNALVDENLSKARYELRSLVSRDASDLSEEQAVSAVVESVAENICDSFVAPLFYFVIFGVPGALAYRVVNTLDAMIGYHGKYEYLGKFAARLDDILNFLPARLSALLLVSASYLSGLDYKSAWRGALHEHTVTESPNAGWTMATVARALGVQLEKPGQYRLGVENNSLEPETIDASIRLVMAAAFIWILICFAAGGLYFAVTT